MRSRQPRRLPETPTDLRATELDAAAAAIEDAARIRRESGKGRDRERGAKVEARYGKCRGIWN